MTIHKPPLGVLRRAAPALALGLTLCGCALDEGADDVTDLAQLAESGAMDAGLAALDALVPGDAGPRDAAGWRPVAPIVPVYPADYPAGLPKVVGIRATGTGCPEGTVAAAISPDGTSLTITFREFEAFKVRNVSLTVKDCHLAIALKSTDVYSYSVEQLVASGFAFLDPGVTASHTMRAYAAGSPVVANEGHIRLTGPFDDRYTVEQVDPLIGPCGLERNINVRNTLQVRRASDAGGRGEGFMVLSRVGRFDSGLRVKLRWTRCNPR